MALVSSVEKEALNFYWNSENNFFSAHIYSKANQKMECDGDINIIPHHLIKNVKSLIEKEKIWNRVSCK